MRRSTIWSAAGGALLASAVFAAQAWGTHKNWMLRDGGTSCMQTSGSGPQITYNEGAAVNSAFSLQTVICPVTLAGRYAGSGSGLGQFPMPEWATAMGGIVYGFDGNSTDSVSCFLDTRSSAGGEFLSRSVASPVSGSANFQLNVFNTSGLTWGGSLGNQSTQMKAMGFRCSMPGNSMIYSYQVHICQFDKRNVGIDFPCHL